MNTERIRELAKQANLDWHKHWNDDESNRLEKFAELVAAEEREACALAAEKQARWIGYNAHADAISAAIRSRGNE